LPALSALQDMREGSSADIDFMFDCLLPAVYGKKNWKRQFFRDGTFKRPSEIASNGTEAFVYLLLENSYETWMERAKLMDAERLRPPSPGCKKPSEKDMRKSAKAAGTIDRKWTSEKQVRLATKHDGWGNKAIKRYNELCAQVLKDRASNSEWEDEYLVRKQKEWDENSPKSRRKASAAVVEQSDDYEKPHNDFCDADMADIITAIV
jgi:hypothetical protein